MFEPRWHLNFFWVFRASKIVSSSPKSCFGFFCAFEVVSSFLQFLQIPSPKNSFKALLKHDFQKFTKNLQNFHCNFPTFPSPSDTTQHKPTKQKEKLKSTAKQAIKAKKYFWFPVNYRNEFVYWFDFLQTHAHTFFFLLVLFLDPVQFP